MKTLEEIKQIRELKRLELDLRINTQADTREKHILVCHGTGCTSSKSPKILENLREILKQKGIENVRVIMTGCFGLCAKGPIVIIRPEDTFYAMVTPEDCEEIIQTHIIEGKEVQRLLCKDIDGTKVKSLDELNFYKKQERIALKNCGVINPEDIELLVCISLSMLPIFKREYHQLKEACSAKGIAINVKNMKVILTKLLVSIMKRVNEIEASIIEKGYEGTS